MLLINNKRIIPAPLVTLNKTITNAGDGRPISTTFDLTLAGSLLPSRGSPNSDGVFHTTPGYPSDESITDAGEKFDSILRKQDALRELFTEPGLILEYGPDDGSPAVLGNVTLRSLSFSPGVWVDRCDYTITLDSDDINKQSTDNEMGFGEFEGFYLQSASETIQVQESPTGDGNVIVTQTVSAVGKAAYENPSDFVDDNEPWENAKTWCLTRINDDLITSLVDTTGKTKYNKVSSENIDTLAGSYSITTTYTISSGNATYIHTYDIVDSTVRSQTDDMNSGQQLIKTININGTITGLDADNTNSDKLAAAEAAFATIEPTIPTLCGLSPEHLYTNRSVTKSLANGVLSYSFAFTEYPDAQKYNHTMNISVSQNSAGVSQITVAGSVKSSTVDGNIDDRFDAIKSIWESTIKPGLRDEAANTSGMNLVSAPGSLTVNYNKSQLQIDYSAVYNIADTIANGAGAQYLDVFEVALNDANNSDPSQNNYRKNSTATINGSITGFSDDGDTDDKYANALSRWNSVKSLLRSRIASVLGVASIPNRIFSKSISFNQINGVISYNYSYSLNDDITQDGIISEDIQVETQEPSDVFAVQIIPGLAAGPILQDIGTVTEARKTLSINLILDSDVTDSVGDERFEELVLIYEPSETIKFVQNGPKIYNPNSGSYSRSRTWIYRGS